MYGRLKPINRCPQLTLVQPWEKKIWSYDRPKKCRLGICTTLYLRLSHDRFSPTQGLVKNEKYHFRQFARVRLETFTDFNCGNLTKINERIS